MASVLKAPSVAKKRLRVLSKGIVDHLSDPRLLGNVALEGSIEVLLERLYLSVMLAKPLGLREWAASESEYLGARGLSEVVGSACHLIANEANLSVEVDHGWLLAFLEILKVEMLSPFAPADKDCDIGVESLRHCDTTKSLLAMLGERDAATCCHSKATGEWARRLSVSLGLAPADVEFVELCAVLHDIGKVSTPDSILLKSGPLTASEWEVMREHAASGERVLNQIPTLRKCAVVVRAHHERFDGTGYPDRLAGRNIPYEARVVAVADAFHAMISPRPYRKAIPARQALEILKDGRGTQWDPEVVDAMLDLFETNRKRPARSVQSSSA
ncbi:MAG: HD-GYP domain-containing protein [Candidatus Baltobacteraceae bacterium]